VGPYVYRADAPADLRHVRSVKWNRTVERSAVQSDLRDSLGSLLTVFELSRHEAARRMDALAATGTDPGPSTGSGFTKAATGQAEARLMTPERLDELVRAAEATGEPVTLTIRQFLAIWGHTHRRPSVIEEIKADLEAQGLATKPPFADGNINSTIAVLAVGAEPGSGTQPPTAAELPEQADPDDRPVTFLVRQLPSAEIGANLHFVQPDDDLRRATTIMGLNNFSQLPVITPEGRLYGAVSWETVGLAYLSNPAPSLADATTRQVREVDAEEDLLDWIEEIYRRGYIITAADLTLQLGSQLRPFLLLAEVERRLRRIIDRAMSERRFTLDQVRNQLRGNRRNRVHEAQDLTMGEYRWILEPQEVWDTLGWSIDRELFTERLKMAAEFRNDLMHLNPDLDPEAESELAPLRGLLSMLRSLDAGV
jgi:restriction system protein